MEYLKGKVKDLSLVSGENAEFMDCCNLLKFSVEEIMSNEEIKACIGRSKKSPAKRWVQAARLDYECIFGRHVIFLFLPIFGRGLLVLKSCQLFLKSNELGSFHVGLSWCYSSVVEMTLNTVFQNIHIL